MATYVLSFGSGACGAYGIWLFMFGKEEWRSYLVSAALIAIGVVGQFNYPILQFVFG